MTINLHISQAVARERATDFHARAAASRLAAESRSGRAPAQPAAQSQPASTARHDLIPAGAPKR